MLFTPRNTDSSHASKNNNDSFFKTRVQPKLAVGQPGDKYEVEADKTADKVVQKINTPQQIQASPTPFFAPKPVVQSKKESIQQKENGEQDQEIQEKPLSESITPVVQTSLLEEPVQEKCNTCEENAVAPMPVQTKCKDCEEKEAIQPKCAQCDAFSTIQRKGGVVLPELPEAAKEKEELPKEAVAPAGDDNKVAPAEVGDTTEGQVDLPMVVAEEIPEPEMPEAIQTKSAGTASSGSGISDALSASKGKGSPMNSNTQSAMNEGFGSDFSNVRIHTDSNAVQMNKELGSHAFTNGSDVYFNEGKYNPDSDSGKHLLAHELTHTVQQGAVSDTVQRFVPTEKTVTPEASPEKPNDGSVMEGNANSKIDNDENVQNQDDLDEEEAKEKKDPPRDEVRTERSAVKAEGITDPPVDRGGEAQGKIGEQKQQMNEKLAEAPPKGEEKKEQKDGGNGAKPGTAEAGQQQAAQADAAAKAVVIPSVPEPFKHPNVVAPVDSVGEPIPRKANIDTQVRGLGYIGEMLRVKGYELKKAAAEKTMHTHGLDGVLGKQKEDLANAKEGTQKIEDHNTARKEVSTTSKEVLVDSKERQAFVAKEAPGLAGEADGGKADSGGLASEAKSKAAQSKGEIPDDEDARADAEKQSAEMEQSSDGAKSMDDAVNQTGERARQYIADAEMASKDNQQSEGSIVETDGVLAQIDTRVVEMKAKNEESNAKIEAVSAGPETLRQHAVRTAQTGDELIAATILMEQELNALQDEYLASMAQIKSKEQAEEELKKAQESQPPPSLSPEEEQLFALAAMSEPEQEVSIGQMTEPEKKGLMATLEKMIEKTPDNGTDETEGARKEVKLGSLVGEGPADPRQEEIDKVDNQRITRVGGVLDVADLNMNYLTAEQQQMLAEKLVGESITDDIKNISILQIGKGMIEGMLDPRMALQGVVDGFGKTLTGIVNIFNAEAWAKDPLGNLLQIGADISTGMAMIFSSVLGVAAMITALMVALIIISWGFATPFAAPVIGWMGTVMTYAGWGAIIAGSLSVLFNSLAYIKNLNDAGTATTARELFGNTEQMKQNATDGFTGAMSIVEGVGAVKMGPMMKSSSFIDNIPKSPGAFMKNTLGGMKDGLGAVKSLPGNIVKGAKKLFGSGKKGMIALKDKIKAFFKGTGKMDVDAPHTTTSHSTAGNTDIPNTPTTPTNKKHQTELLDDAKAKNLDELTPEQRRIEIAETSKSIPREIGPDSPYHATHDIEIEANGHTYRRRKDGNGWCRFSNQKCGIPENELPVDVQNNIKKIDANSPEITNNKKKNDGEVVESDPPKTDESVTTTTPAPTKKLSKKHKEYDAEIDRRANLPEGDPQKIDLETADELKRYNHSTDGGATRDIDSVVDDINAGKTLDPETSRFGDPDGKKPGLSEAEHKALQRGGGGDVTPQGGKELEDLKARKAKTDTKIKEIEADIKRRSDPTNMEPDAIAYRDKKAASLEKRKPKKENIQQSEAEFDQKYGQHRDQIPDYDKKKAQFAEDEYSKIKSEHSEVYDQGKLNNEKGTAFEEARAADGGTRLEVSDKKPVKIPPDGREINISPDIETPTSYVEMKSGKLSMSPDTIDQIARYAAYGNQTGKKIVYELLEGADPSVIKAFQDYGIGYIDYSKLN